MEDSIFRLTIIVLVTLAVFVLLYCFKLHYEVAGIRIYYKEKKREWSDIFLLLAAALLVKMIFASYYEGHGTDMNCFYAWSDMIFENGIGKFYYMDTFTDYPPGYMLILWVIAGIRKLFSIETVSTAGRMLIKLVPVLSDLGTGFLVYILAKRRFSEGSSLLLTLTYVLNPIVLLDSSVWGQTDSVFTLLVLLTCYFCMEQKRIPAYFVFAAGVLIKPQTLIFTPILIWTILEQVFLGGFDKRKVIRDLIGGVSAIAMMVLTALPFGIEKVFAQYVDTLGSYEYCTINAYNIWALFGKNWADQTGTFLFMQYRHWGTLAIIAAVVLSGVVFFRLKEDRSRYFISMSVVVSTMFLFSVRMHERYLFPVVALTLCAFLVKPAKELFFTYVGFAIVQFMNVFHVYYYFVDFESTGPQGGIIGFTALLTLGIYGYMYFAAFAGTQIQPMAERPAKKAGRGRLPHYIIHRKRERREEKEEKTPGILATRVMPGFTKWDWIVLGGIMLLYSVFALHDLGNTHAPQTEWQSKEPGSEIILDLGEPVHVDMIHTFLGTYENRGFTLSFSQDGENYADLGKVVAGSVFCWDEMRIEKQEGEDFDNSTYNLLYDYQYVRLTSLDNESALRELIIRDADGNIRMPVNAADYPELFDEQEEYVSLVTFREGTYFDEIYHARTAYEMTEGMRNYEWTHPPLGKFFISLGVRVFGMNPFGWRIAGVLFGIAMLPFMYLFGRRLFGAKTWAAGALTFLFAFDFMHFTQTRIATIDVYGTFFIIAMFFFMYWYSQMSFYDTPLHRTFVPLGLSAVAMGLGCASKWTAVYAAAGLGLFFFAIMFQRVREYRLAKNDPSGTTNGISHEHILDVFRSRLQWTLLFCILFFIIIAGLIYLLSYIPFSNGEEMGLWDRMIRNQGDMFRYHAGLTDSHPFESSWYQWPIMYRPMYYYCQTLADGLKEGISAFGNPLVWWAGIPAVAYMVYRIVRKRDRTALFLVFAYLVQYVPWMRVPRCTFAYHYFPSVPFVAMMLVYIMVRLARQDKKWYKWIVVYLIAAFVLFLLFYPVLSGQPVTDTFVRDGLRWLPKWQLVS